jgi:hypothetical protein
MGLAAVLSPQRLFFFFSFYLFFSRGILEIPLSFDFETFQLKDKKNKKRVVGC